MTPAAPQPQRQAPVAAWVAQMIGTLVLAAAVLYFVRSSGISFAEGNPEWQRYAMPGTLVGVAPAMLYLRTFKPALDADEAAIAARGAPDPGARARLMR